MEITPEQIERRLEEHIAGTRCAQIVAENLALPFRIGNLLPAFRHLVGFHDARIVQKRIEADRAEHELALADARKLRVHVLGIRQRTAILKDTLLHLREHRRVAGIADAGDCASGRLLDTDALTDFSGASNQHFNRNAGLFRHRLGDLADNGKAGAVINEELAFLLCGGNHSIPGGVLRMGRARQQRNGRGTDQLHNRPALDHCILPILMDLFVIAMDACPKVRCQCWHCARARISR